MHQHRLPNGMIVNASTLKRWEENARPMPHKKPSKAKRPRLNSRKKRRNRFWLERLAFVRDGQLEVA